MREKNRPKHLTAVCSLFSKRKFMNPMKIVIISNQNLRNILAPLGTEEHVESIWYRKLLERCLKKSNWNH